METPLNSALTLKVAVFKNRRETSGPAWAASPRLEGGRTPAPTRQIKPAPRSISGRKERRRRSAGRKNRRLDRFVEDLKDALLCVALAKKKKRRRTLLNTPPPPPPTPPLTNGNSVASPDTRFRRWGDQGKDRKARASVLIKVGFGLECVWGGGQNIKERRNTVLFHYPVPGGETRGPRPHMRTFCETQYELEV